MTRETDAQHTPTTQTDPAPDAAVTTDGADARPGYSTTGPDGTPRRSAERVVEVLQAQGVTHVFGVPGAKVDQVYDALLDSDIEIVVSRHEQNAAFMAAAMGRLTGRPGVALVTSGPGTTNLATGLLTATAEGDPMVALCGAVPRADRLKRTHQSMSAAEHLATVSKWAGEVNAPDNVAAAVTNAFRRARVMPRGATSVVLPSDVLAAPTEVSVDAPMPVPALGPAPRAGIEEAARLVREARLPVVLAGMRAACEDGAEALRRLMAATELPVVETFQAAGIVSRDLEEHFLGRVGLFRNQPGDVVLDQADVVLAVGYDTIEYDANLWNTSRGRTIINLDEVELDVDPYYQPQLELRGDIPATIDALTRELAGLTLADDARERLDVQRARLAEVEAALDEPGDGRLDPVKVTRVLRDVLPDDATVSCDVGSHYIYLARYFRTYEPRTLLFSNGQQTLGVALPWAIAATIARPGRVSVSVSGDGGFLFSAMELETAVRLGSNLVHVVFNDGTYDMVAFQQQMRYGRTSGVQLGDYDVVGYAQSFGAHGHRVTSLDDLAPTLRAALAEDGPSVIDVPVDYASNARLLAGDLIADAVD